MIDKYELKKAIDIVRGSMDGHQFGLAIDTLVSLAKQVISGELVDVISKEEIGDILWQTAREELYERDPISLGILDTLQMREKISQVIYDRLKGVTNDPT